MQTFLKPFKKLAGRVLLGLKQGAYIEGGETAIGAPIDVRCNELVTSLLWLLWRRCLMERINMAGKLSWMF